MVTDDSGSTYILPFFPNKTASSGLSFNVITALARASLLPGEITKPEFVLKIYCRG